MFKGLARLFGADKNPDSEDDEEFQGEQESSFVFTEHMRIVLAIVVAVCAAMFMWWIVA